MTLLHGFIASRIGVNDCFNLFLLNFEVMKLGAQQPRLKLDDINPTGSFTSKTYITEVVGNEI